MGSCWVVPAPLLIQLLPQTSLLYSCSLLKPVKCHCFWDLSPSFKCGWNWQVYAKVIKGGLTDSLTRYLISLGNQAKKKKKGLLYKNHIYIFFKTNNFLCSPEHQRLAKAGGIFKSNLNFRAWLEVYYWIVNYLGLFN